MTSKEEDLVKHAVSPGIFSNHLHTHQGCTNLKGR